MTGAWLIGTFPEMPERLHAQVTVEACEGALRVLLDGRPLRTPRKAALAVPNENLARAVAAEWQAQGGRIDPRAMPLTGLANAAIDLVRGREGRIVDAIVAYAASDLLCYRAEAPEGLIARQCREWDPVLAWAAQDLGAPLAVAEGVMPVAQPPGSLARLRAELAGRDAFALAALRNLTALTGSALLALAHAHGRLTAEQAWAAAHVDEDWQMSQWGEDSEAMARRARRRREFDAAARLLALLA